MYRHLWLYLPLTLALGCRSDNDLNAQDSGPDNPSNAVDEDGDGVTADEDCDDADPATYPGADEVCDGADNDCDDAVDEEPTDGSTFYADADGDGFGDADASQVACEQPSGTVSDDGDCDDAVAAVNPGAEEVCDDVDNDCDGTIDEDATDATIYYADTDGDGYGDADSTTSACSQPTGFVSSSDDCDDGTASTNPGADERCDDVDNDCDTSIDEDAVDQSNWYLDADGDGYGTGAATSACDQPDKYGADDGDCDDGDPSVNPGAAEICDGDDEDCVGGADNGFDLDGDGVARCCEAGDYVLYYPQTSAAPITRVAGKRMPSFNGGSFGPEVELLSGHGDIRMVGYANVLSNDHSDNDLLWYKVGETNPKLQATTCLDGEWQTQELGPKLGHPRSWTDANEDGKLDYVYYEGCCNQTTSSGGNRSPVGETYLGDGDGNFTKYTGASWDVAYANNQWAGAFPMSLGDWDGDGHDDIIQWAVSSGGSSSSSVWYLAGDGQGNFAEEVKLPNLAAAGGYGDMGDIDGDGCVDFLSGGNDDTNPAGKIRAMLGDCAGGVKGQLDLADQAAYAASAGGGIYGDGFSVLYDADDDGDLDLFTSYNRSSSSQRGPLLYWANNGAGNFGAGPGQPTDVVVPVAANKYYTTVYVPVKQD